MKDRNSDIMRQGFMGAGKPPKVTAAHKKDAAERAALILARLDARA